MPPPPLQAPGHIYFNKVNAQSDSVEETKRPKHSSACMKIQIDCVPLLRTVSQSIQPSYHAFKLVKFTCSVSKTTDCICFGGKSNESCEMKAESLPVIDANFKLTITGLVAAI